MTDRRAYQREYKRKRRADAAKREHENLLRRQRDADRSSDQAFVEHRRASQREAYRRMMLDPERSDADRAYQRDYKRKQRLLSGARPHKHSRALLEGRIGFGVPAVRAAARAQHEASVAEAIATSEVLADLVAEQDRDARFTQAQPSWVVSLDAHIDPGDCTTSTWLDFLVRGEDGTPVLALRRGAWHE